MNRPAHIEYNNEGNIIYEEYRLNGKVHRMNGPASIEYKDMKCCKAIGYIDGKRTHIIYDLDSIVPHNSIMIKIAQRENEIIEGDHDTVEFIEDNGGSLF